MLKVLLKLLILMCKVLPHKTPLLASIKAYFFFLRVVAIKNYYPEIRIIIQLLQYMNKVRWKLSSFLLLILLPLIVMDAPKPWKLKANSLILAEGSKNWKHVSIFGPQFQRETCVRSLFSKKKIRWDTSQCMAEYLLNNTPWPSCSKLG